MLDDNFTELCHVAFKENWNSNAFKIGSVKNCMKKIIIINTKEFHIGSSKCISKT
jgi:hypothetical protein